MNETRKNKSFLGVYITKGQNDLLSKMKKEFGKDKTEYIKELLDKNLVRDIKKVEKEFNKKKENGLV